MEYLQTLKFFGSAYKIMLLVAAIGLLLLFFPEDIKKQFYLDGFINSYGTWIGIATLVSTVYTIGGTLEKISAYIKNKIHRSRQRQKLLETLIGLELAEKNILFRFLNEGKSMVQFYFAYTAAIPDAIGHLKRMRFLQEVSSEYGTYYYRLQDEVWNILIKDWQKIFYEAEFQPKNQ